MKVILSVIAVCLVMITAKLYIPEAQAEDRRSISSIERIIEDCRVTGTVQSNYVYGQINC